MFHCKKKEIRERFRRKHAAIKSETRKMLCVNFASLLFCSFGMFYSPPPYSDLIFQDAAQQLQVIDSAYRSYGRYLGKDFLRARRVVDCHAGADISKLSIVWICISTGLSVLMI